MAVNTDLKLAEEQSLEAGRRPSKSEDDHVRVRLVRLVRDWLPTALVLLMSMALVAVAAYAFGARRHAQDLAWCRKITPTSVSLRGKSQAVPAETLKREYATCAGIRRSERGVFGAVWKTGGEAVAACNADWGRYQQLAGYDPGPAHAVIAPYGIADVLDSGSMADKDRFIKACLALGARPLANASQP